MINRVFKIFMILLMINVFFAGICFGTEEVIANKKADYIVSKAKIIEVIETKDVTIGDLIDKVQVVKIRFTEGVYKNEEREATYTLSYDIDNKLLAYELEKGNSVMVQITEKEDGSITCVVEDVVRQNYIILMITVFFISVIAIGGRRGAKAIFGLIATILAVYFILIKSIFAGYSPILMSIVTSAVVIILTFLIIGGINKKIITAALGTLGGVVSSGLVALIFNNLAKLSGICEDAIQLTINMQEVVFNFREILLAGIVVSALGACMDVGMSIASSLDEIKIKNPEITWKELLKSGMNIGRDVIGTMTNTLILAYVGGSIVLILLMMATKMDLGYILNKELIATEIISAVAGSMGVVYTVPITSAVYAFLNKDKTVYKKKSKNIVEGKRSLKI